MKAFTFLSLLVSLPAFAAPSNTVVQTTATVDLHDLVCVKRIGMKSMYTQISNNHNIILGSDGAHAIELKHVLATGDGCDEAKLLKIQKQAMMGFGFLYGAPVTVTKEVGASQGDSVNGCVADYLETVKIDLGLGISVSSQLVETRPANDCR